MMNQLEAPQNTHPGNAQAKSPANSPGPSVYYATQVRAFLIERIADTQERNPELSIRKLASLMGFKSHALLLLLIQGKRPLRVRHATSLARGLGLTQAETLYLQGLIQLENAKDIHEQDLCRVWLSKLHPEGLPPGFTEIDQYQIISEWIHFAVLATCSLSPLFKSAQDFLPYLRTHFSLQQLDQAIERLTDQGYMIRNSAGFLSITKNRTTTKNDSPNQAVKLYHQNILEIAKQAVVIQALENREFQSFSIATEKLKLPLVKKMIREFTTHLIQTLTTDCPDTVYQFGAHFFQLTESRESSQISQDEGVEIIKPSKQTKENPYENQ